jgi:hypothetical protein
MKTSYKHLQELCALPPDFNARCPQVNPRSRRVRYLLQELKALKVEHHLDTFAANGHDEEEATTVRFANVMACVPALSRDATASIVLLAHHDVANPNLENANDNTASLGILLELLGRLQQQPLVDRTVWVVFTDAEEVCSFHRSGAWRLALRIQGGALGSVSFCLNLELTAHGECIYVDQALPGVEVAASVPLHVVKTPFSDSTVLRRWGINRCATIGTLAASELQQLMLKKTTQCPTWMRCHRPTDRLQYARASDMAAFGETLLRVVSHTNMVESGVDTFVGPSVPSLSKAEFSY